MKTLFSIAIILFLFSCKKEPINVDTNTYDCALAFEDQSESHPKKEKFESAMQKVKAIVPGVQIAVRSLDGNVWLGSQGLADIPNSIPFKNCTKTMIGSISKIHTAVLIMQLHEEGVLSINDPIKNWIPVAMVNEIANAEVVTIKQLLNHTSGIKDYLGANHHIDAVNTPNYKLTPEEKLTYIYGKAATFNPGERYGYSNSNYVLLGLIIEKGRNTTLADAERLYITEPLGLLNTLVGTSDDPIPTGTARPYIANTDKKYTDVMHYSVADAATGDGGIATNMQESLTFIESLFNGELVSEATLNLMLNERVVEEGNSLLGESNWYGLGLEQAQNKYGLAVGHSGSTSAYWSFLIHFPENNVTVSIGYNGDTENNEDFQKLLGLILEVVDIAFE